MILESLANPDSPFIRTVVWLAVATSGFIAHEVGHFLFGYIFRGGPYISQYTFGIPTRVSYEHPYSMADWQVRITGGYVYLFLLIAGVGLWFHWELVGLFGIAAGITISPSDLNAAHFPAVWKQLTAGESVDPEDWE